MKCRPPSVLCPRPTPVSDPDLKATTAAAATPAISRRMAAFLYEGVLLFGVVMVAGFAYSVATQMRNAAQGTMGLQVFLFLVLGVYFVWFWSRGGQTVATKAWHIRLVDSQGCSVTPLRATFRYLLAWLWFVPALSVVHTSGLNSVGAMAGVVLAGIGAYAALAWLRADKQFLHDVVCGTRLIHFRPPARPPKAA